jgi:peroxiredoxin
VTHRLAPEFRGAPFDLVAISLRLAVLTMATLLLAAFSCVRAASLQSLDGTLKPDFYLLNLDGKHVALGSSRGRIIFVHFFATWCEPCREELPALNRLFERSKSDATIIAISVADNDQRLRQFFAQMPVGFSVLHDRDLAVAKSWSVSALPTTYVLGADLTPMFIVETDFPWDTISVDPAKGILVKSKAAEPVSD